MRWRLALLFAAAPSVVLAADPPPAPVRNAVLALQQQGAAMETLIAYYDGRIEELKRLCGDPCKDK